MITTVDNDYEPFKRAIIETFKTALRAGLSVFIGLLLDGLVSMFANIPNDTQVIVGLAVAVNLMDRFWHIYNKEHDMNSEGKSLGIFRF